MYRKKTSISLERQLYYLFFLASMVVTLLSLGTTLYFDIARQKKDMDASINGTAAYISAMPDVISMLEAGYPSPTVKQDIDSFCDSITNINVVLICDKNGLRFYHTDRHKTGDSYVAGDETEILNGSAPYITVGYGTKGNQRRAFHSIKNEDGDIIGFVMASVFTAYISDQQKNIIYLHIAILGIMIFVSFFLTHSMVRYLRKSLLGFHPGELLHLYLRQDEVLNAVEEGLVASDLEGNILFANPVARRLFTGENVALTGRALKDLYPDTRAYSVIQTGKSEHRRSGIIGGRTVLTNEIPIRSGKKPVQGVLTILFDQTDMLKMTDELSGTRSMLDTLRSFNHEFLNKLHIILGYLQTGETQKAIDFIINSNLVSSESVRRTADSVRVSKICALIIGKMMHAAELGVLLTLTHDSRCMENDLLLPPDACVTVIGNLLENAIEELGSGSHDIKEIKLGIYCRPDCNIITCEDTGNGIAKEIMDDILKKGCSKKGENRGTGLYLVSQIIEQYQGELAIETETGEGTCFTLTFTKKEAISCTESL